MCIRDSDATYSNGQRVGATTAFENGKKLAEEVLRGMAAAPKITAIKLGHKPEVVLERSRDMSEVRSCLDRMRLSDGSARIGEALALAGRYMSEKGIAAAEIYIFSDMQKTTWSARPDGGGGAAEEMAKLSGRCRFVVADAGGEPNQPNYWIASFQPREKVLCAGVETAFDVVVEGKGPGSEEGEVRLTLWVNDQKQAEKTGKLSAGRLETSFPYAFLTGGDYFVKVVLEGDALPVDNRRYYLCRVPDVIRVLLLDETVPAGGGGDASGGAGGRAGANSRYLRGAIAPMPWPGFDRLSPFTAVARHPGDLVREDLALVPIVAMVGVRSLSKPMVTRLEQYVGDGGRLLIFAGEGIEDYAYNSALFRDGGGLLPCRIGAPVGDGSAEGRPKAWISFAPPLDPAFARFREKEKFDEGPVFRYLAVSEKDVKDAGGSVLLRFSDGVPAVIEKRCGRGRVVFVNTSADGRWNSMPFSRDFPVFVQELLRHLMGEPDAAVNLPVGGRYEQPVMLSAQHMILVTPSGDKVRVTPVQDPGAKEWKAVFTDTSQQGLYRFEAAEEALERPRFVANLMPDEGDPARFTEREFASRFGSDEIQYVDNPSAIRRLVESLHSRKELAMAILWTLGGLLLIETFLAMQFGKRRV
ncbi:MAG: VWA domain-containing protein, partial [Planctomycetota bacterium]|nr:VWA domain-containing protein [Planctomycetota bacterium]